MSRFRVVIAGGGVAAVEGLLRLRRLAGDEVDITLVAPNEEFAFRALAVGEPFGSQRAERYPLARIARDMDAGLVAGKLARVDMEGRTAHTDGGGEIPFDALLVAVGGTLSPAFDQVTTFQDDRADEILGGLVADLEQGYVDSLVFLLPAGPVWPLPLYELALMTAESAHGMGMEQVELSLVTPEPAPLGVFGGVVSDAVAKELSEAGIALHLNARPEVRGPREVSVRPGGHELHPTRMVAMPRLRGPEIAGLPTDMGDFILADSYGAVPKGGGRVFAAGDAVAYPVKHGSIGAQQADAAAEGIARLAGAQIDPRPFVADLHGVLFTGRHRPPLYISATGQAGGEGFESRASSRPPDEPAPKVAARELATYLVGVSHGA